MPSQDTDKLITDAVTEHYATHDFPLYLAELGKLVRSNKITMPDGVRFKDYLKSRFHERLFIVQDEENPAKIAIAPPEMEKKVMQQLSGQSSNSIDDSQIDYARLPFALIAAFCKIPPMGTRVYFCIVPPFRYQTQMQAPDDNYIEIDDQYRLTSFAGNSLYTLSSSDKQSIYQQIENWARDKSLDLRDFYYDSTPRQTVRQSDLTELGDNALKRLISAQDQDLRRKLRIPGDIADILMRLP